MAHSQPAPSFALAPEAIRLAVKMSLLEPLSWRNMQDLLHALQYRHLPAPT
jgi:hypothetical protein